MRHTHNCLLTHVPPLPFTPTQKRAHTVACSLTYHPYPSPPHKNVHTQLPAHSRTTPTLHPHTKTCTHVCLVGLHIPCITAGLNASTTDLRTLCWADTSVAVWKVGHIGMTRHSSGSKVYMSWVPGCFVVMGTNRKCWYVGPYRDLCMVILFCYYPYVSPMNYVQGLVQDLSTIS